MKFSTLKLSVFVSFFPLFLLYASLFWASMYSAKDRLEYLKIFGSDSPVRTEPIYTFIARSFNFFIGAPDVSLTLFQFFVFIGSNVLLYISIKSYGGVLVKFLLWNAFLFSVNSVSLGVQIRIGFASVFLVLLFQLYRSGFFRNKWIYLLIATLFVGVHYGVVFFVFVSVFSVFVSWFSRIKLYFFVALSFSFLAAINFFSLALIKIIGISSYYSTYFDGGFYQERLVSFSFLFYSLVIMCLFYLRVYDRIAIFGYTLFVYGVLTGVVVFQKFGSPFVLYSFVLLLSSIRFDKLNQRLGLAFIVPVFPVFIIYYCYSVSLF